MIDRVDIYFFIGQLRIPVVIIVVEIRAPVMHGEKLDKADLAIPLAVFCKMRQHHRQFQQLIQ